MGIQTIFNMAAEVKDAIYLAQRATKFFFKKLELGVPYSEWDPAFNSFAARQDNYINFVQKSTSEASVDFSNKLMNKAEDGPKLTSWDQYFSLIKETMKEVKETDTNDGESFLGQLAYRTEIFEDYYKGQSADMKTLIDLFVSKTDAYELCMRTPQAADIVDARSEKKHTPQLKL